MRRLAKFVLCPIAAAISAHCVFAAEIDPAAVDALLRSADVLSAAVAKSSSYSLEATATISHSDFILAGVDAAQREGLKVVKNKFQIAGKDGQISILLTPVEVKGAAANSERYILNDESAIFEIHGSESYARIFPASEQKIYEVCPFLAEFSFLREDINPQGISSWLPTEVADFGKAMRRAIKDLKSIKVLEGDGLLAEFERPWGKAEVTFRPKSAGSKVLYPVHTTLLSKSGAKWREIEITEFPKDVSDAALPLSVKYSTYSSEDAQGKTSLLATWAMEYKGLNIESEVDDSAVTFDPSRMSRILDTKTRVWLTVPK